MRQEAGIQKDRAEKAEARIRELEAQLADHECRDNLIRAEKAEARLRKAIELLNRAAFMLGPEDAGSAWHRDFAAWNKEALR